MSVPISTVILFAAALSVGLEVDAETPAVKSSGAYLHCHATLGGGEGSRVSINVHYWEGSSGVFRIVEMEPKPPINVLGTEIASMAQLSLYDKASSTYWEADIQSMKNDHAIVVVQSRTKAVRGQDEWHDPELAEFVSSGVDYLTDVRQTILSDLSHHEDVLSLEIRPVDASSTVFGMVDWTALMDELEASWKVARDSKKFETRKAWWK